MDETMREFTTGDLDQILDEARINEADNQIQALMPEKEAMFRRQMEEEAQKAEASEEIPEEEEHDAMLSQETIRLDDLQEVFAMTSTREFTPVGDEEDVTDETIRLDDITRDAILEELLAENAPEEPETVNLEDEYDEEGFVTMPLIFLPKQRLRELKRKLVAGPEKRYYELAEQGVGKLQLAMLVCLAVIGLSAAAAALYGMDMVPENRMKLMVFGQILAMLIGALMGCQQMIEGVCELFRGRFTLNTMLLVTFLACCADAVLCLQELRVPICGAFTLEVFMALWAAYHQILV